jgi:hypothetical protein
VRTDRDEVSVLESLLELAQTDEFEDAGEIFISTAVFEGLDLRLQLQIRHPDGENSVHSILCHRPRKYHVLAAEVEDSISLLADHVLLWPHVQPRVELYFNRRVTDGRALLGALFLRHQELVGDWFPFAQFMNSAFFQPHMLETAHGQLAEGPTEIIAAFVEVLKQFDIRTTTITAGEPAWWDGTSWRTEVKPLHVLLIGNSYVVSPAFTEAEV